MIGQSLPHRCPNGELKMQSKIAAAIGLDLEPVALIWSDEKPSGAMEFAHRQVGLRDASCWRPRPRAVRPPRSAARRSVVSAAE